MLGAQAQILQAAQLSLWARTRLPSIKNLEDAIWKRRTLVRAWGMRRTMFLIPSDKLSLFVRGTARRPEYNYQYALKRVASKEKLDRLLDRMIGVLAEPHTRNDLAASLKSMGYNLESKAGGGWGDSRSVPWVEVGNTSLPVGFLLHTMAARYAICSGPSTGAESTYVRAERWVPKWRDMPQEKAEEELLLRYLRAHGPANITDYAIWIGLYVRDVKAIWPRVADKLEPVDIEGQKAWAIRSDVPEIEKAKIDGPVVRLLPFFDSFILGHKSHRNIVDESQHKQVYRNQGWVSPVLLVNGRATGVWSHAIKRDTLVVSVSPFSRLPAAVTSAVRREASELGRFLGCPEVKVSMGQA